MVLYNEEGEKFACEQCIKGHRVSSCQHSDRPLQHVNKKGRPVSQCTHCRGLRKSRATHTRCHCGDAKAAAGTSNDRSCGCMTGKSCTCALKKEAAEIDEIRRMAALTSGHKRKPSITTRRSDGAVTKYRNVQPPLHRHSTSNLERVWPYPTPRPQHTAQRSLDSLPLDTFGTNTQSHATPFSSGLTITPPRLVSRPSYETPTSATPESAPIHSPTYPYMDMSPMPNQSWSLNDMSYSNLSTPSLWHQSSASSTANDHAPFAWSEWDFSRSPTHGNPADQYPPSVGSGELSSSSQPGISTPSKSGSISGSDDQPAVSGELDLGYNNFSPNPSSFNPSWTFPSFASPENAGRLSNSTAQLSGSEVQSPHPAYPFATIDTYLSALPSGKETAPKEPVIAGLDGMPSYHHQSFYESSSPVHPLTVNTFGAEGGAGWNSEPMWQNLASPVYHEAFSGMGNAAQPVWS